MAELVLQYITPHSCHNLAKVPIVHPGLPFFSQLARERQLRCRCQQQRAPSLLRQPADKLPQRPCDKATQTYWRPPSHAVSPHIHTQVHTLNIILDFFFSLVNSHHLPRTTQTCTLSEAVGYPHLVTLSQSSTWFLAHAQNSDLPAEDVLWACQPSGHSASHFNSRGKLRGCCLCGINMEEMNERKRQTGR